MRIDDHTKQKLVSSYVNCDVQRNLNCEKSGNVVNSPIIILPLFKPHVYF